MKSACNKSCRSSHKDSRTVEFEFLRFFTNLYRFYNFAVFETKEKQNLLSHICPGRFWGIANRSLPNLTGEERTLGAEIRRGRSPTARGRWGISTRGSRGTRRWSRCARRRPVAHRPRRAGAGGARWRCR